MKEVDTAMVGESEIESERARDGERETVSPEGPNIDLIHN